MEAGRNLPSRAREQAVFSDFRHRLLERKCAQRERTGLYYGLAETSHTAIIPDGFAFLGSLFWC